MVINEVNAIFDILQKKKQNNQCTVFDGWCLLAKLRQKGIIIFFF